ncbi:protein of unknown function [Cupriavidus neocaledonicus]|uniref:Uncharacterized protein n=1 Tax=Cupriavidus neocaledonicus TaxID=1040979 RepID=A0A375H5P4_9BURK|nr:hypothetical protein CBM2605_A60440 [Cupriavidus neocaledonicus]SPD45773.1 protein of unknown function [Cupriavidus neocaledonicus]
MPRHRFQAATRTPRNPAICRHARGSQIVPRPAKPCAATARVRLAHALPYGWHAENRQAFRNCQHSDCRWTST